MQCERDERRCDNRTKRSMLRIHQKSLPQLSKDPEVLRSEDFFDLILNGVGYENNRKLNLSMPWLGALPLILTKVQHLVD